MFFQLCLTTFSSFSLLGFFLSHAFFDDVKFPSCLLLWIYRRRRRQRWRRRKGKVSSLFFLFFRNKIAHCYDFSSFTHKLCFRLMTKYTRKCMREKQWKLHPDIKMERALTLAIFHGENVYCFSFFPFFLLRGWKLHVGINE